MEILVVVIFWCLGFSVGYFIRTWLEHRHHYDGKIIVTKNRRGTLYSLELEDYPDKIEFKKEVILKVDASEENLNRE